MERVQERIDLLGRSLALLATYALVVGAISVVRNLGGIADGEAPATIRLVLGVVGVAAGVLVWTLRRVGIDGWQALMVWSVAQVLFIAWSVEGNALRQLWDVLLGVSSETTVNGVVTSSEHYGLNAVGIVLVIWTSRTRERWNLKVKPMLEAPATATASAM
jgi:hypothetical protein